MKIGNDKQSRREFIISCLRKSAFAGLAGLGAFLVFKRQSKTENNTGSCFNNGICRNCNSYNNCVLPQALSARKNGMTQRKDKHG